MNRRIALCVVVMAALLSLQSCTNGEEERIRQEAVEQARQDSLERVRQAEMETARRDSLEAAAMAAADAQEEEPMPGLPPLEFDPEGQFTIQVQSWRSREKALNRSELLRSVGFEAAYITEVGDSSTGDVWYRVKAGNVATMEMAKRVQDRLQNEYDMESWIDMAEE